MQDLQRVVLPLLNMPTNRGEIGKISVKNGHEVEWRIENFLSYAVEYEYYCSPNFQASDSDWCLQVYPNGQATENCVGWISLFLHRKGVPVVASFTQVSTCPFGAGINTTVTASGLKFLAATTPVDATRSDVKPPTLNVRCAFGVKKVNGTIEHIRSDCSWVFEKGKYKCGYPKFMQRSGLLQRKSDMVASEPLTFTCSLWVDGDFGSLDTLSQNLVDLFVSGSGCDATLKVEDVEFPVHKLILSARSPVLAAMFETDMKEKRTGLVEIEDCDPEAFREFLAYLYSGKVEKDCKKALELYRIADKYDVQGLKSRCVMSMIANMSVENVPDAAIIGCQFAEAALMRKTQEFFNGNFKKVIASAKWDTFLSENMTVANRLLKAMAEE